MYPHLPPGVEPVDSQIGTFMCEQTELLGAEPETFSVSRATLTKWLRDAGEWGKLAAEFEAFIRDNAPHLIPGE